MVKMVHLNKYILLIALAKASIAGAGFALAFLASIDIAIAQFAKEAWDAWQVDQMISRFALGGACSGLILQVARTVLFR